ncbi:MAG: purine-nucleoside phosphorylase [Pseudomonadota bacterium]
MRFEVEEARAAVLGQVRGDPRVGVVLGSGLGAFAERLSRRQIVPYEEIPYFPVPRVLGHAGNLCVGDVGGATVACLQGRVHAYEGHALDRVVFGVRLLAAIGCHTVLVTNAAGGIGDHLAPGDLMLITDHLNLTGRNPLVGPEENPERRFPDMSEAYDPALRAAAKGAAQDLGIALKEGVYAGVLGPSYETPAEIRMLRTLGADAVGMSTVLEVIALRHLGVRVGAVSAITNRAAGLSATPLRHDEVQETARKMQKTFVRFLTRWIELATEASAGV